MAANIKGVTSDCGRSENLLVGSETNFGDDLALADDDQTAPADTTIAGKDLKATTGSLDAATAAVVTNNLNDADISPEGILISNLPYIALALVAIGGLVAYVIVRRQR